jgi:hypothetical protein
MFIFSEIADLERDYERQKRRVRGTSRENDVRRRLVVPVII